VKGIVYDRMRKMPVGDEFDGQMAIAAVEAPGVEVTYRTSFLSTMPGNEVWDSFSKTGKLTNDNNNWVSSGEDLVGAIAVTFTLNPGEKRVVPMVLAWDFPVVEFGQGRKWYRHYTNFYGTSGQNAWRVAKDGLLNASAWSDAIDSWQAQYVNNEDKPLWYRSMLFNELYTIADGGSFWGHPIAGAPKNTEDTF
jgi:non-lysosomal glucosylceramidase